MSRYIVIISVIFFGLLGWQSTVFAQTPIPDIQVNGSDEPITLSQSDTLTVTVTLDNNDRTDNADWWLAADTPFGLWFFTFEGWTDNWQPVYQGPLFYLDPYEVFSTSCSGLEEGTYIFYFGVDTNMDGDVTWNSLYCDTMVVNVGTTSSEKFVQQLVNLDKSVTQGQISNDEFITAFSNILKNIDDTPNGTELVQTYLEEKVLGYSFTHASRSTYILETRVTSSSIGDIINYIKNSKAYQMLEEFLKTTAFSLVDKLSLNQLLNADAALALSANQVRIHIYNAWFSGEIDGMKALELFEILNTNPFEALKQLLKATGKPIPSWLEPALSDCLRNCGLECANIAGNWSGTVQMVGACDGTQFNLSYNTGVISISQEEGTCSAEGAVEFSTDCSYGKTQGSYTIKGNIIRVTLNFFMDYDCYYGIHVWGHLEGTLSGEGTISKDNNTINFVASGITVGNPVCDELNGCSVGSCSFELYWTLTRLSSTPSL